MEGIGKECWPDTLDPEVVDDWVRVSDRDSFVTARRLARGGLLVGGSTGSTAWAGIQVARKLGPGHESSCCSRTAAARTCRFYDDNWMIQYGFLERTTPPPAVEEVLRFRRAGRGARSRHRRLAREGRSGDRGDAAVRHLAGRSSARPVDSLADVVGSLQERGLLERVFLNADALSEDVAVAMQPPLAAVDADASIDEVYERALGGSGAVVVVSEGRPSGILTRSDLLAVSRHVAGRRVLGDSADRHVDGADDDEGAGERPRARPLAEEASRARSRRAG